MVNVTVKYIIKIGGKEMKSSILLTSGQNLFDQAWTEGNLYSIQDLVAGLGSFCCTIISIVGFGIVIFSILKNALSGLYVVNPKFWDKVDEVKRQTIGTATDLINDGVNRVGGGNVAAQKLGGLFTFILSAIPNVKDLTDFEDGIEVDKKQYFARSIPLLVAQIFIGMLIFYGYPAKIANWVGSGATHALTAVLNNVDPVEFVTSLSEDFVVYSLSTDGSTENFDVNINKMTVEMMGVVKTRYSDMEKDPAQETAYYIENNLLNAFNGPDMREILGAREGYSYSINVGSQSTTPVLSAAYAPVDNTGVHKAVATNGTVSIKYWVQGTSLPTGSTKVGSTDYFVWTVTATPVALTEVSSSSVIMNSQIQSGVINPDAPSITASAIKIGSGTGSIKGTSGQNATVNFFNASGSLVHTGTVTILASDIMNTTNADMKLVFDAGSASYLNTTGGTAASYCVIDMPGTWTYTVTSSTSNTPVTLTISKLRLDILGSGASVVPNKFASTAWSDVDMTKTDGWMEIDSTTVNVFLTKSKLNE